MSRRPLRQSPRKGTLRWSLPPRVTRHRIAQNCIDTKAQQVQNDAIAASQNPTTGEEPKDIARSIASKEKGNVRQSLMKNLNSEVVPRIAASTRQPGSLSRSSSMNQNREPQYRKCDPDRSYFSHSPSLKTAKRWRKYRIQAIPKQKLKIPLWTTICGKFFVFFDYLQTFFSIIADYMVVLWDPTFPGYWVVQKWLCW